MSAGGPVLGLRELNRALMARQLLDSRSGMGALPAVAHLVGIQAQAVRPPYVGLWTRLDGFALDDLERLLLDRSVVRVALMRSTLHLVTAQDCLALRPLLAEQLARVARGQFGRQVAGVDLAELARLTTALVEERPLGFAELGERLQQAWPDRDAGALAQTARNLVPLVQVPPRGLWGSTAPPTHTTVTSWLGQAEDTGPSLEDYVLRYLSAYGPASVQDMQKWSGLTRLQAVVTRLAPQLRTSRDDRGRTLYDLAGAEPAEPDRELPVRYLSEFDDALLGHVDRRRVLAEEHGAQVFTTGGIIRATVLVDGFVAGTWRFETSGSRPGITVRPFAPLPATTQAQLAEEGARLLRAVDADTSDDPRVRFESPA
ncbi:winged helix DNA-binding domain-containing protein [Aquipuribacter hungaricus]|uniref:Winged helix DNA-binding domain-containing protein n=1 Tax=Aquipuribacter hungaricus TaxID=545624 RepID=A0ABV7WEY1_9MICO